MAVHALMREGSLRSCNRPLCRVCMRATTIGVGVSYQDLERAGLSLAIAGKPRGICWCQRIYPRSDLPPVEVQFEPFGANNAGH